MSEPETMKDTFPSNETPPKKGWFNKKPKVKKPWWKELLEWIVTLVVAAVIALVVRTFLFEPVRVDGSSMANTLVDREVMFVTKPEYIFGDPQRFDVVICHYPGRGRTNFVKRVVGLPGDTVEVRDGYLYVNDVMYKEPYITHRPNYTLAPYTVPEGMYFVLGDNRANSNDSHIIGPIEEDMIVGHVRAVFWPLKSIRGIE